VYWIRIGEVLVLLHPPQNSDMCCEAHLLLRDKAYGMGERFFLFKTLIFKCNSVVNFTSQASILDILSGGKRCFFFVGNLVETQLA
jgi:hypothetical protein